MSQPRTPREDDKLERTRYFPEQILSPADFARDREYLLHRHRRHNRMLHGWGIKLGLTVENVLVKGADDTDERKAHDAFEKQKGRIPEDVRTADGPVLLVKAGYAITPLGDEVYLPDSVYLNTSEELEGALVIIPAPCLSHLSPQKVDRKGKTYYLVVEAYESETHPVRAANTRCGDHPDHFEFSRIRDTLRFRLVDSKPIELFDETETLNGPPVKNCSVLIATIEFDQGRITNITLPNSPIEPEPQTERRPEVQEPHIEPPKPFPTHNWFRSLLCSLWQLWQSFLSWFLGRQ